MIKIGCEPSMLSRRKSSGDPPVTKFFIFLVQYAFDLLWLGYDLDSHIYISAVETLQLLAPCLHNLDLEFFDFKLFYKLNFSGK